MTPPSSNPSAALARPAEIPVVGYVRSSKDLHDVSCEAQAEQLLKAIQPGERFVSLSNAPRGIFEDKALSSTRDDLPGLLALLDAAKQDPLPFRRVYVLDTSRVARDTLQAQSLKFYLRKKRGIELVFLHLPQTGSYMDEAIEKMMEVWDELHSRMSKAKGVEGQKQNVRRGYRAGGEAPYGYRRRVVVIGQTGAASRSPRASTSRTLRPHRSCRSTSAGAPAENRAAAFSTTSSVARSPHRAGKLGGRPRRSGASRTTSTRTSVTSCTDE